MYIVSISIDKRYKEVPEVQTVLTEYGEDIEARLGLHNKAKEGLIIIVYNKENIEEFVEKLTEIGKVSVNYMEA